MLAGPPSSSRVPLLAPVMQHLLSAAALAAAAAGPAGPVGVSVDWAAVLARHDPVWQIGGTNKVCSNVSGLRMVTDMYGVSHVGQTTTCTAGSSDQQCLDELEAACFAQSLCTNDPATTACFGIAPAWRGNRTSQLFTNVASLRHHPGWNVYIPDPSLPTREVCVVPPSASPPTEWEDGPFFGNGLVGGLFTYASSNITAANTIIMQIGRTDVWDQRKNTSKGYYHGGALFNQERLPIGQFELSLPAGVGATWRMALHDAEVTARLVLPGTTGNLSIRALAPHTEAEGLVVELNATTPSLLQSIVNPTARSSCSTAMKFILAVSESTRQGPPKDYQPNPPAVCSAGCGDVCGGGARCASGADSPGCFPSAAGGMATVTNALLSGGNTATAFKWVLATPTTARLFISIANDAPKSTSSATAAATVERLAGKDFSEIIGAHRAQWSSFWSDYAYISISQPQDSTFRSTVLEGFYYIQQYKLGSSIRKDGPALDLAGCGKMASFSLLS